MNLEIDFPFLARVLLSENVSHFAENSTLAPNVTTSTPNTTKQPSISYSCEYGSFPFFMLCCVGGALSCGLTHTATVPLDLVKCRLQTNNEKYKYLAYGLVVTIKEEGYLSVMRGWAPTCIGYSLQGVGKFGLYEAFKMLFKMLYGAQNAYDYRTSRYILASASGEFLADIPLCPMEAVKVKIQTTEEFTDKLTQAIRIMYQEEGIWAFYKGIVPLWARQIPYTVIKFTCFESIIEFLYRYIVPKPWSECSKIEQLLVTFGAGYIAGVFCAIVSHPADTVVSKINHDKGMTVWETIKSIGFVRIWRGLGARIFIIGTLTAAQWLIYDFFKVATRMPRSPPPGKPK